MTKILFICHGNICRSPMAEFIFKYLADKKGLGGCFEIDSAATSREEIGNTVHRGALKKLKEEGIPVYRHYARQITKEDYEHFDYIIAMERYNVANLRRVIGEDAENKVKLLLSFAGREDDIADPWYTGNFDEAYEDIMKGCEALIDFLLSKELQS